MNSSLRTLAALLLAPLTALHAAESKPVKPNIVFLLADDLRPDCLGVLGHPIVKTPHIDKLLERGFIFRNTYVLGSNSRRRLHPQPHDDSDRAELSASQPHHPDARADDQGRRVRLDPQRQVRQ